MGALTLPDPEVVSGRFVQGMDEEEYHAHPALSQTGMKRLLRSPRHYRASRETRPTRQQQKAFDVGSAAHSLVLGVGAPIVEIPSRLLSDDGGIRTKAAKDWKAEHEAAGKIVLKASEFGAVSRMANAILRNEKARRLLELPGYSEVSLFGFDPMTGVEVRSRLDRWAHADLLPLDVKTTQDVRERKLATSIVDLGYDVQAAVYRWMLRLVLGVDAQPMHFIFVEKDYPHDVRVVPMTDIAWQIGGEKQMREALDLYAWCREQDEWPGPDDEGPIRSFDAPSWYRARFMEVGDLTDTEGTAF